MENNIKRYLLKNRVRGYGLDSTGSGIQCQIVMKMVMNLHVL
jgi:hypothetical protein